MLSVSRDVMRKIQKRHLERRYLRPRLKHLAQTGIDGITIGKGRGCLTIVFDPGNGTIVFAGDRKGSEALLPFCRRNRFSRVTIEPVAMDISPFYIGAVNGNAPKAQIVIDYFHVVKPYRETPGLGFRDYAGIFDKEE